MGDQAIINVAKVLDNAFSEEDLACRFGGDEFAIFIKHGMTMDELKGAMEELRSKLRINAGEMKISCSIGVALFLQMQRNIKNFTDVRIWHLFRQRN